MAFCPCAAVQEQHSTTPPPKTQTPVTIKPLPSNTKQRVHKSKPPAAVTMMLQPFVAATTWREKQAASRNRARCAKTANTHKP